MGHGTGKGPLDAFKKFSGGGGVLDRTMSMTIFKLTFQFKLITTFLLN